MHTIFSSSSSIVFPLYTVQDGQTVLYIASK